MPRMPVATTLLLVLLAAASPSAAVRGERAGPLPTRTVTSTVVTVHGHLVFRGTVSPGHANKTVLMQKRTCRSCVWKLYAKVRTNDASRYRVRIQAPRHGAWFWRAKVRAYGRYGTSYSGIWKTFYQ